MQRTLIREDGTLLMPEKQEWSTRQLEVIPEMGKFHAFKKIIHEYIRWKRLVFPFVDGMMRQYRSTRTTRKINLLNHHVTDLYIIAAT